MRLFVITDLHGDMVSAAKLRGRASSEGIDLIVIAGDITRHGTVDDALAMLKVFHPYPTFFVPGNCDPPPLAEVDAVDNAFCVHGKPRSVQDICILGVGGGTVSPFKTPFELGEEQLSETLRMGLASVEAGKRLILVTHTPPKNTKLDAVTPLGPHIGSLAVRRFIEERAPLVAICGHMHERRGVDRVRDTIVVNPGPVSRGLYALVNLNAIPNMRLGKV